MFIVLDNTQEGVLHITASLNNKIVQSGYVITENNDFLLSLKEFFAGNEMSVRSIEGFGVRMGRGKFTATRLLTTMVNALAFGLQIPIMRIEEGLQAEQAIDQLSKAKKGEYILPQYSAEPHISSKQVSY